MINIYGQPTYLYVDGDVLYSEEGTTQVDPLAAVRGKISALHALTSMGPSFGHFPKLMQVKNLACYKGMVYIAQGIYFVMGCKCYI